jgi:acetyl-CoA decarbonylase/synthase complex subunit delta
MAVQIPIEKWSGAVRAVTLGAAAAQGGTRTHTVTVGGETTLPFLHFEGSIPHAPTAALEIRSRRPADWSPLLLDTWGPVVNDPAAWAKAAETAGAGLITLTFSLEDSAADARAVLRQVLNATGLPLLVFGPGQAEKDNELIVAAAE